MASNPVSAMSTDCCCISITILVACRLSRLSSTTRMRRPLGGSLGRRSGTWTRCGVAIGKEIVKQAPPVGRLRRRDRAPYHGEHGARVGQAEPGAALPLGGEKGVEDVLRNSLFGDAAAVVEHLHDHLAPLLLAHDVDGSSVGHRVTRIEQQIDHDVAELGRQRRHGGQ